MKQCCQRTVCLYIRQWRPSSCDALSHSCHRPSIKRCPIGFCVAFAVLGRGHVDGASPHGRGETAMSVPCLSCTTVGYSPISQQQPAGSVYTAADEYIGPRPSTSLSTQRQTR